MSTTPSLTNSNIAPTINLTDEETTITVSYYSVFQDFMSICMPIIMSFTLYHYILICYYFPNACLYHLIYMYSIFNIEYFAGYNVKGNEFYMEKEKGCSNGIRSEITSSNGSSDHAITNKAIEVCKEL